MYRAVHTARVKDRIPFLCFYLLALFCASFSVLFFLSLPWVYPFYTLIKTRARIKRLYARDTLRRRQLVHQYKRKRNCFRIHQNENPTPPLMQPSSVESLKRPRKIQKMRKNTHEHTLHGKRSLSQALAHKEKQKQAKFNDSGLAQNGRRRRISLIPSCIPRSFSFMYVRSRAADCAYIYVYIYITCNTQEPRRRRHSA